MKKLLAFLLSMMMAVSLAVPAFADDPDGPPTDEAVPSASVDEPQLPDIIGGMDDYWDEDFDWWAEERAYLDSHPGLEEQLRAGAYDYFEEAYGSYYYWDSPEEYMEMLKLTEEEFLEKMVLEQVSLLILAGRRQQAIDAQKEAMGGVPGQIGVMVNGQYIRFPDAAPEAANGRTMVPVRALVETLGGEVDYRDGAVRFVIDGREFEFTIGGSTVTVCAAGIPVDTIQMDCATYAKNNRTYVPVRFIGDALGYEVDWDGEYQTAILLDREALAADIDKDFTILNRAQAAANPALEEGESWSADMEGSLTLTLFDTLNGDQTYTADLAGKTLFNNEALNASCSVTFSDSTLDALMALMIGAGDFGDETEENVELMCSILTGLEDMEVIMTREGLAWFHAPILDELGGQENVWFAADLGAGLDAPMSFETDAATVGSALSAVLSGDSVEEMAALSEMVGLLDRLYGDNKFTTSGGISTRTIGVDELIALYGDMGVDPGEIEDEFKDIYKEFSITMKVDSEGGTTVTGAMETAAQLGVPATRMTVDSTRNARSSTMTVEIHVANLGKLELTLTAGLQAAGEAPRTEPPEGAVIVKMDGSELTEP